MEGKIKEICDALRKKTIEPAKQEALQIVENAKIEKEAILQEANKEKEKILEKAKKDIEDQKNKYLTAIKIAGSKVLEEIKKKIENIFNDNVKKEIEKASIDPKVIANFINVVVEAIRKEGIESDLSIYIPKNVDIREVSKYILADILKGDILKGEFVGGAKIKINEKGMTVDVSQDALSELLSSYIRKDFRDFLFKKL